jgi:putative transposase
MELHFFDPKAGTAILERRLPHWLQPGVVCFITFRTHDSMPQSVVEKWLMDRSLWLRNHGIAAEDRDWKAALRALDPGLQQEFYNEFSSRWHNELDSCHGASVLRDPANAGIVAESFHQFDGDRYVLTDFVVMPNHMHLLAAFLDDDSMLSICESWKRFTGRKINQRLGVTGRFWQQDGFDHLVRSESQFEHYRRYIANNPRKANLKSGEFIHYSHAD